MDVKVTPKLIIRLIREFCNLNYSHVSRLDANLFYRPCGQGEIRTPEDRSHLIYSQAVLTAAEDCGIEPHPNTRTKQISSLPSSPSELVFLKKRISDINILTVASQFSLLCFQNCHVVCFPTVVKDNQVVVHDSTHSL